MDRLPGLEFIDSDFAVYYAGAAEPQIVVVSARAELPVEFPLGPAVLPMLCDVANRGGAGGAEFAPTLGSAKLVSGPNGESPKALSGEYHWQIELTGVSPLFMRNIVDRLRTPDQGWKLLGLHIIGSRSPTDIRSAVDDVKFKSWLTDSDAYLGAWPEVPFQVIRREILRGAAIRIQMWKVVDYELAQAFEELLTYWYQAITGYVNASEEFDGVADSTPRISCGHSEIAAGWDAFDFLTEPVQRVLINMLVWFHHRVAPISSVELAFQS